MSWDCWRYWSVINLVINWGSELNCELGDWGGDEEFLWTETVSNEIDEWNVLNSVGLCFGIVDNIDEQLINRW